MKQAISAIFKTFFLSLCIIANTHFAYAQTASILPPAKTTFVDQNGKPLTSGTVDFYIPSTTTRKTTWQDAGETILNTNPVVLDAAGRALILGSGSYRQVVKDRLGNTIWDQVTSSTGSGSSGPTATGDGDLVGTIKPWAGMTAPNQYMFTYGQEVSRTTFATLFTAITSAQSIFCSSGSPILTGFGDTTNFPIGAAVEVSCVVSGASTIVSKTSTSITLAANANVTINTNSIVFPWGHGNGSTTFNLPDFRGFVIAGNNNMGGVPSSILTVGNFGAANPNSTGAAGGGATVQLGQAQLPIVNFIVASGQTVSVATTPTDVVEATGLGNFVLTSGANNASAGNGNGSLSRGQIASTGTVTNTGTAASGGSATPFSIIQPTKTSNYIIKVTPDTNSATASGVTSLGGMTGDIACGSGLLCTGNIVSVTSTVTVNTDHVNYTAPYSGAKQITQTVYNNNIVWATDFDQIDATGATDSVPGIRAATSQIEQGYTLKFPGGNFLLNSCPGDDAFGLAQAGNKDNPISIEGTSSAGFTGGTVFILGPSIPDTCDILRLAGTGNIFGRKFSNFSIRPSTGFYAAGVGRHALHITSQGQPNYFEYHLTLDNVQFGNMKTGESIKTFSSPNVNVTATTATTNMTITGASAGTIFNGAIVNGLAAGTTVVSQTSGTTGGNGVYVISISQTFGPGSVTILGNNGGGSLNNALISNNVYMSVNLKGVGDNISFFKNTVGQGELRGDPGYIWDQVDGATSVTVDDKIIVNVNGGIIVNGGINPRILNVEIETASANTHGSVVDINGATSKVLGGSMEGVTLSQNFGTGTIFPVRVNNSENFSVSPNNRLATSSGGGQHISITSSASNTATNGNYCTSSGTQADCLLSNASSSINNSRVNIGFANGTDLLNVGGITTTSGLHMPGGTSGTFTLLPPLVAGTGAFRFSTGTNIDGLSTGGAGQGLRQSSSGGAMDIGTFSITVNGTTCTTGSSCTVTATASSILTFGTHLTSGGASYNGSTPVTITSDATAVNTASTIMARDGSGQVAATTFTGALAGNATTATSATSATNTAITDDTTTNATMFPTWVTANTGNLPQKITSTKLSFNPSIGALSSTSFTGAPNGLTFPYFLAQLSADQTFTTGVFAVLSFATEIYDNKSWYDPATFKFTPLVAGKYNVTVQTTCTGTVVSGCTAAIAKNGTSVIPGSGINTSSSTVQGNMVTMMVDMNGSTDFLQAGAIVVCTGTCKVAQNNPSIGQAGSWFQAHFIGP